MRIALLLGAAGLAATAPARGQGASAAGDYRFTPALKSGQRLLLSNIDGSITVTQGGSSAEVVVHKIVHRGDASRVKAVLEQTADGYHVCAVYLARGENRDTCSGDHHNGNGDDDPLDVELQFEARVPAGVRLDVHSVDGSVTARGIDTPASIRTVDGSITFDGTAPESLNTVDGRIDATLTGAAWTNDVALRSVDGGIDVTLPAGSNVNLVGSSVDGEITSDFPVTLAGKWGPRSVRGAIGSGGSRELRVTTVDGAIRIHRGR